MRAAKSLMSLAEVREELPMKIHINSIRRWIIAGVHGRKLKGRRIARHWYVHPADLQEFLSNGSGPPRPLSEEAKLAHIRAKKAFK